MRRLLVACAPLIASSLTSLATSSQGRGAQTIDADNFQPRVGFAQAKVPTDTNDPMYAGNPRT